jgi:HPt (histidine-containing phosphotransfer) domain-containing protein
VLKEAHEKGRSRLLKVRILFADCSCMPETTSDERVFWQMPEDFERLREKGESGILIEVLELFLKSLLETSNKLEIAVLAGDAAMVTQMLHKLKGSALQIEAQPLAEVAARGESLLKTDDLSVPQWLTWMSEAKACRNSTAHAVSHCVTELRQSRRRAVI